MNQENNLLLEEQKNKPLKENIELLNRIINLKERAKKLLNKEEK